MYTNRKVGPRMKTWVYKVLMSWQFYQIQQSVDMQQIKKTKYHTGYETKDHIS